MRKQEYLHVHALFVEVARTLDARGELPPGTLAEYDRLDVSPSSVHESKRRHHAAVMTLSREIAAPLPLPESEQEAMPVR